MTIVIKFAWLVKQDTYSLLVLCYFFLKTQHMKKTIKLNTDHDDGAPPLCVCSTRHIAPQKWG